MRGYRPWATQSRRLLCAPLLIVILLLLAGTGSASSAIIWKAPYSGSLHTTHRIIVGTCATAHFGGLHIDRTNGHVSGGATISSTAACSHNSSSNADLAATDGLILPSFSGRSGNFTVLAHWKLDFKVDLTVSGSNCQMGTYAVVNIGFGMLVYNVSNGTPAGSAGHASLFKLTSIGTANHLISQNLTVKLDIDLASSVSYEVAPGVSIAMASDAPPPAPPATSSCTADAALTGGSSSGIAVLVSVAVL